MDRDMKIAFVLLPEGCMSFPPRGSLAIWIYEVATRLARASHVTVFANQARNQDRCEVRDGVEVRRIHMRGDGFFVRILDRFSRFRRARQPLFASFLYHPGSVYKALREMGREHWDMVHILNFSQLVPLVRWMCPKAKIVLHMHCEWLTQLDRAVIARRLEDVDLIIGCSEYVTNKIRSAFPRFSARCRTIWNGVDAKHFAPRDVNGTNTDRRAKRVLFVGRISPEKGLHVLVDAWPSVLAHFPLAQLDIVGPEMQIPREYIIDLTDDEEVRRLAFFYNGVTYCSQLKERIRSLGIEKNVNFYSQLPQVDLLSCYRKGDVFVFPSICQEAFGMPLIEAMACETPVVATRGGGIPEVVVHGKTGILIERGDVRGLAEALLRVLEDQHLARSMGKEGRKRALELFSWDSISDRLLSYYRAIA